MAKPTSTGSRRSRLWLAALLVAVAVGVVAALAGGAFASSVDTSVVDAIAPTGSVTLAPGGNGSITINLSVTGNQVGTATFEVNRNWTLSGGTFTGSNPQQFTVPPRASGDAATNFQTTGTVAVDSGQADGGPFTLHVGVFDITNTNTTGAKLTAGATASYSVTVQTPAPSDTTAPTVNVSTDHSVPASGWFANSPQQVDVSAYDASGVTNIQCSVDGGSYANASSQAGPGTSAGSPRTGTVSVSGDGSHVVVCRATDGASPANTGAAAGSTDTVTVNIDTMGPTVNCAVPDQSAWYADNVDVTCTASDGGSDLADSADANFTLSTSVSAGDETDSAQTSSKTVYDNAGNSTTAGPYTFKIDRKAPQQSNCDTADGHWHPNDVTLHCTYTDGGSGPASQTVGLTTNVPNGTETSNAAASANGAQACDNVGNCADSPADISGNMIDKKAPVISDNGTSQTPTGNDGTNEWFNHDVTVDFSATDGGSGVACTTPWTKTTSGEGANVTVASGPCADNVGNTNPGITSSGYHIDKTKPTVSVTGVSDGAAYTLGSVPSAGCSTSDALSGVHTQATLTSAGGPVGSVTATCSGATDNAGNTNSASATYTVDYNFTGFFQPVDNPPTCNTVKAGQAIPVKFSLHGYQGLNILASGSPSVAIGSCTGVPVDAIETTVTAGNSSLSYDPISDQYAYVWKTDKAWAGTALRLSVELADGTTHYARFSFTK